MYALAKMFGHTRLELVAFYEDVEHAAREAKTLSSRDAEHVYRVFSTGGRLVFLAEGGRGRYCRRETDARRQARG
jgi:hypothetical protein